MKRLVAALEQKFPNLTAEEIAEILWLTLQQWQLQQPSSTTSSSASQSAPEPIIAEPPSAPVIPSVFPPRQTTLDKVSPEPSSMAGVTTQRPSASSQSASSTTSGAALALPDTRSLHQSLELLKALRPLIRQVPSGDAKYLDIPATVRAIADTDVWLPKLRPDLKPWLELAIVVDTSASMVIWQRTILDLRRVLAQSGVFRDVRMWSLEAQETLNGVNTQSSSLRAVSNLNLYLRPGFGPATVKPPPCRPQELLDPSGRRLIIVVSDCIAPYWDTQQVRDILQLWGDHGPMALMQVLPEWLWNRTALLEVALGQVVGSSPGQENRSLTFVRRGRWLRKPIVGVRVPVVTLDHSVLARWSQMIAGNASVPAPGLLFSPAQVQELFSRNESGDAENSPQVLTPSERLEQFRNFSSPMARKLAGLLAACPEVNLPIVRMVQDAMLPEAQQVHMAEVLLGGLFKPQGEVTAQTPADEVQYVFHAGVQPLIQHTIPPEQSFQALSTWIQRRFGYSLEDFRAYITPERIAQVKPFAGVLLDVLKRRGNQYNEVINEIEAEFRPRYTSAVELTQQEAVSQDYEILTRQGTSEVVVIAIHGGNLQPGTTKIADAVADDRHSFYSFVSLKPEIDQTLYIPSTRFDEPTAREMVRNARTVLSIHGCQGDAEFIRVGGADRDRIESIIPLLVREAFTVNDDRSSGTHPNNICNQGLTGRGVQIEISRGLRDRLISAEGEILEQNRFQQMVSALRQGLETATLPETSDSPLGSEQDLSESDFPNLQILEFITAQLVDNISSSQVSAEHTKPQEVSLPRLDVQTFFNACDPSKALSVGRQEDRQYYIDFSAVRGGDVVRQLWRTITSQQHEPTCQLFTGHIGCGKTTELFRLKNELEQEGFYVVYFESSADLDMADVEVSDILLAITRQVSSSLETANIQLQSGYFTNLFREGAKILQPQIELSAEASVSLPFGLGRITARTRDSPQLRNQLRQYLEPRVGGILEAINQEVLGQATALLKQQGRKGLVVIIDNLDRVNLSRKSWGRSQPEYLFIDRGEQLRKLNCHVVYTIPLGLIFSENLGALITRFDRPLVLPMVAVTTRDGSDHPEGMSLLKQMVLAMAFPSLMPDERLELISEVFDSMDTLERLCRISGGHLRSLLALLYRCLQAVDPPIQRTSLETVIRENRDGLLVGIRDSEWTLLHQVVQERVVKGEEEYQNLRRRLFVFEYQDTEGSWFGVNPLIAESREFQSRL